jgi:glycosyltransferase involved in cell wall biosynthesis
MDPIRLALVITELDVGGAERCLANLAARLDQRRFLPIVYCLAPRPSDDRLVEQLRAARVPVEFLGARSWRAFFAAKARLRQRLAVQSPHVLQTFLFHANVLGPLAAASAPPPRIVLGVRVADPSPWRRWLESRLMHRADRVVCVSRSVAAIVGAKTRVAPEKLVVIPNGLEESAFASTPAADLRPLGVAENRRVLLFVGRLHRQKGLDWLLAILPSIFGQLPDHDLLLVGEGPQRAMLQRMARSPNLRDRVHFVGRRDDVLALLRACDVLLLPSRWEGMPNVVLEAMAAGRPVVASRVEGVAELLGDDGADLQSVEPGDAAAFITRVVSFAQNAALAGQAGIGNQRRAATQFRLADMVARYETLYESLVRGS